MHLTTRAAISLVALGFVIAACSGTGAAPTISPASQAGTSNAPLGTIASSAAPAASTAGGAATDVCALVSEAEAKTFLGYDPGPGVNTGTDDAPACAYGGSLTFSLDASGGRATYDADHGAAQGSGTITDLTGVGDAGYAFVLANTIAQMVIVKGSTVVTFNVQGDPSLQNITVASLTTLGTTAMSRL